MIKSLKEYIKFRYKFFRYLKILELTKEKFIIRYNNRIIKKMSMYDLLFNMSKKDHTNKYVILSTNETKQGSFSIEIIKEV